MHDTDQKQIGNKTLNHPAMVSSNFGRVAVEKSRAQVGRDERGLAAATPKEYSTTQWTRQKLSVLSGFYL